ncbi:MAG TPA: O-antigen ligase family protein [Verrucomicrobiae bacterium]|nr:O-antigen ligase family protein [Verrucomicrobiae bacterium]
MVFFYWLVSVMPLEDHWLWGHVLFGTFTVIKALGLLCFLIAVYRLVSGHVSLRRFYGQHVGWCLLFLAMLSLAATHSKAQVAPAAWSHILSIILLFVTVLALVNSRVRLSRTLLVAIGAGGLASLYTVRLQRYYGEGYRGGGLSLDSNYFAMLVGLWIPIAFLWAFSRRPRWERLFCAGCLVAMLMGAAIAASRGGFLGLAVACLYIILRSKHRVRNLLIAGAVVFPLSLFALSGLLHRFTHPNAGDRFGEQARIIAWKAGLRMIEAHPLAGVGLHNFEKVILQYEDPAWLTEVKDDHPIVSLAHNTYVELTAETGLPGLFSFLIMLIATFCSLECDRRRAQRAKRTHFATIALGLQAGLLSFAISAFFLSGWWEKMVWLLIFLPMCLHRMKMVPKASAISNELSVVDEVTISDRGNTLSAYSCGLDSGVQATIGKI